MSKDLNKKLQGKDYWRSLDELAGTPEFKEFLENEFPKGTVEINNAWSRRSFLTLMGASLALAGLSSCRRPEEKIIPFVKAPEEIIPGISLQYATNMPFGNSAYGLVVETHEGRPTKIEGNKLHPSSLGAANSFALASILGLYDPDRSKKVFHKGSEKEWSDFAAFWIEEVKEYDANSGEGLAVLSEAYSSPTIERLRKNFEKKYPKAVWVTYDPISDENIYNGIKSVIGKAYKPVYHYDKADVVLSLDSDFLQTESESLSAARGFAAGRKLNSENDKMNRLYVVESNLSLTGGMADHRLRIKSSNIGAFAKAIANELGIGAAPTGAPINDTNWLKWVKVVAADLSASKGKALVVAGYRQPAEVHALVYTINEALGALNNTVDLYGFNDADYSQTKSLVELTEKIRNNQISNLIMFGGDPAYNAPADLRFASALKKVPTTIHVSAYNNSTSMESTWHIPMAHYLESWGDSRSIDGTAGVIQPMIEPLHGSKSYVEVLSFLSDGVETKGYELVKSTWNDLLGMDAFEMKWRRVLHDGLLADSSPKPSTVKTDNKAVDDVLNKISLDVSGKLEVVFAVSQSVFDGRFANCGWLMELPDPVTKLSWDNAAVMSINTASKFGLNNKDVVVLGVNGREIEIPVWTLPGHADDSITVELGYGHSNFGRIADGVGSNAYLLRASDAKDFTLGATLVATGRKYEMSNTQDHSSMEGRPIIREASLDEYRKHPNFAPEMVEHPPLESMWNEFKYDKGNQWGMTIDLNACTGCNACALACQSENNIPVVGKEEVGKGREMHWLRIDRYFTGDIDDAGMVIQPVACHHCELAPCEQVCPVAATAHNSEGLNTMAYNRCIGTRYCSNNCPYKVRRFNFFNYTKDLPELVKMAQNPDVTVRSRGVMEKCTYCVQRITSAKITAKKENRDIRDGEVITACQQACPTNAISFGSILDKNSEVVSMKKNNRNYDLLAELNIKPRTSYLAKIRNPNPDLA